MEESVKSQFFGNKIALWNVIQGVMYITLGTIIMAVPQIIDIFTTKNLTNNDYQGGQVAAGIIFIIGSVYLLNGLEPFVNTKFLSILIGKNETDKIVGGTLSFSFTTVIERLTTVPLICIIIVFTFGKNNPVLQILGIAFLIADPLLAILTVFIIKKYSKTALHQSQER